MSDINWKDGAVCYADGKQWFVNKSGKHNKPLISETNRDFASFEWIIFRDKLNINKITTGDYIPASELETEQKYNEVVEVFGLFGFKRFDNASYADTIKSKTDSSCLKVNPSGELICNWHKGKRKLTYHQVIAIGKLKRMMLSKIGAESIDSRPPKNLDDDNSDIANDAMAAYRRNIDSEDEIGFIAVKHESAVTAMEKLSYKYCENEKQWYKEIKEWV